ncbi:MAG TPA: D-Ala-D-Ala carboxypeptidase family metallohydrolase [Chitinophagales bacterium]|nr:D-Ala-D-Ala carboxypeptidase family metallohydrolase [Chitinophagales bacterium]HRK28525.1 D-Ala-D-Ala carboxypeptidase family metallohydrolase [Chitinophagales bacterium]
MTNPKTLNMYLAIILIVVLLLFAGQKMFGQTVAGIYARTRKRLTVQLPPDNPQFETAAPQNNTTAPPPANNAATKADATWADNPTQVFANFKPHEFDSPDAPGSGMNMRLSTLQMLQNARNIAALPFKINSGFRTIAHNNKVKGVKNSAHTRGYAIDIATTTATQAKVIAALRSAGFKRIGIYKTFVHADNDPNLPTPATWYY